MQRALREYRVEGIQTNLAFFREVLDRPEFRTGEFDTGFIDQWLKDRAPRDAASEDERDLAVVAAILADSDRQTAMPGAGSGPPDSQWKTSGRIRGLRK